MLVLLLHPVVCWDLGPNTQLCMWVLDFLIGRPQVIRVGSGVSSTLTLNTGAPQGCAMNPLTVQTLHLQVCRHSQLQVLATQ